MNGLNQIEPSREPGYSDRSDGRIFTYDGDDHIWSCLSETAECMHKKQPPVAKTCLSRLANRNMMSTVQDPKAEWAEAEPFRRF